MDDAVKEGIRALNGASIVRREGKPGTIFIPLPRALWREIDGGCACRYCSADPKKSAGPAYWDTLAVASAKPAKGNDTTWMVHYPELHYGNKPKRATETA
jgi:hypothetical protein